MLIIYVKWQLRILKLNFRPARFLYNETKNEVEVYKARLTQIEYINSKPLSSTAKSILEDKLNKIDLLLEAIRDNRFSLLSLVESSDDNDIRDSNWFKDKTSVEKFLDIKIDNDVVIGEWEQLIKMCNDKLRNKRSRSN